MLFLSGFVVLVCPPASVVAAAIVFNKIFDKLGGASEKKIKNFAFHFVFHSACTNFAL